MTLTEWLTELEELDKKATKGPWDIYVRMNEQDEKGLALNGNLEEATWEDVEFMRISRTALPKAVKIINELKPYLDLSSGSGANIIKERIEKIINEEN
jgi:hypothetical protein